MFIWYTVTAKAKFNYIVNLDLNYLQFNFPHGITTGAAVQFRADDVGTTEGGPKPSSVGLTSLVAGQVYYAIAGNQTLLNLIKSICFDTSSSSNW